MPAPVRASLKDVISAARSILEASGADAVTMSTVAAALGIRPPSLYKKVADRSALLGLIAEQVAHELIATLASVDAVSGDPRDTLVQYARAYRSAAAASPQGISLLFIDAPEASTAMSELLAMVLKATMRLTNDDPLPLTRTITSWLFGFCSLEQAGAFRSGGDVDEAFDTGLARILPEKAVD